MPRARGRYSFAALPLLLACAGPADDGTAGGTRRAPPAPAVMGSPGSQTPPTTMPGPIGPMGSMPTQMPPGPMPAAGGCGPHDPGPWVLRRLSHEEYENSVRDLTGYPQALAHDLLEDEQWGWRPALPPIAPASTEHYLRAAAKVSEQLLAGGLRALAGCDSGEPCARKLIAGFAARAYRRPLQAEEVAILEEAYRAGAMAGDAEGLRALVLAVLQAPQFLYRLETGQPRRNGESFVRLTSWETAARLSYHFWGTVPDAPLAAAAEAGQLDSPEQISAQVQRLLADPRARDRVGYLQHNWLQLARLDSTEKDTRELPSFTPALRAELQAEIARYLDDSFWDPRSNVEALLTSPHTFVNAALAAHYGLPAPAGPGLQRVALDPTHHAGLLTRGPLMTMLARDWETSVVQRGVFVLNNVLCMDLPPPPAEVEVEPPREVPPNATMRERLEEHGTNPSCRNCHELFDPIGFALETFDALGRFRSTDKGRPIDTSGHFAVLPNRPRFKDALEMSRLLAAAPKVRECMVRTWFELAFARRPDEKADACTLQVMSQRFASGGQRLPDLFVSATETDAFRFRRPSPGGQP
jgi:Protein of unknown function (DUF1592)/Protein of unknown function (DUF1588)/Protein of unknown function (DUF1595)/Protein of unknown function (DUF1587)/Protein of unknown function (DUF1585)